MHLTITALITLRRGRGYQTPIINDNITLKGSYYALLQSLDFVLGVY